MLTPFMRQGLEAGEKMLYIADARNAESILGYLQEDRLDTESCLARGQLEIVTADDLYLKQGVFDPDEMIALLRAKTEQALAEGYTALRVTGEMTWALRGLPGSRRLIEYETKLNEFFPGSACLAICQYHYHTFAPSLLLDVLTTHPVAIVGTAVYDNFYYMPSGALLSGQRSAARLRRWLENLADRGRTEEAHEEALPKAMEARPKRRPRRKSVYGLTPRQVTVVNLLAQGKSDKDIAIILDISPRTAERHVADILRKMAATSRTQAGVRALKEGLVNWR